MAYTNRDAPAAPMPVGYYNGLTIREHFAGLALVGLLAADRGRDQAVQQAVAAADALIDALNAKKE